jgi:hypothetical protein
MSRETNPVSSVNRNCSCTIVSWPRIPSSQFDGKVSDALRESTLR